MLFKAAITLVESKSTQLRIVALALAVTDAPEPDQFRSLDCSGYVRMVFGYRSGLRLSLSTDGGASLPRRAVQMADAAPGIVLIANSGAVPARPGVL